MKIKNNVRIALLALMVAMTCLALLGTVLAIAPIGATVSYQSNSTKNVSGAGSRTDEKGYIHTANLDATQQDYTWKAYVGNVTSTFTLDDSADYTIYQWAVTDFDGEVYISRNQSITWDSVKCASTADKETEDTRLGHTSTAANSINQTFNTQTHAAFWVGDLVQVNASDCFAIATWVNDTTQSLAESSLFQEVLLSSASGSQLIYASLVESNELGYKDDGASGTTYDFQSVIPDNATDGSTPATYYFYVELQSS